MEVIENIDDLKNQYKKENNSRIKTRLKFLILSKENPQIEKKKLAEILHLGSTTLLQWTKKYNQFGVEYFTKIHSGGNRESGISKELHDALEEKMNDSENSLLGYWHAVEWVKENFNQDINYFTLRAYLIRHFHTKKKHPRKSHYKKSEDAIVAFKKNPPTPKTNQ